MNLYLISQDENNDFDTWDAAVVAAASEHDARNTHPGGNSQWGRESWSGWCRSPEAVKVEKIGRAAKGVKSGLILASFNAG